jgi:putative oxidoreductase
MFPRGAPGIALLLLRFSVGANILLSAWNTPQRGIWVHACAIVVSILLYVGFLTPIAACLTIPLYLVDTANLKGAATAVLISIAQAVSLALLGPGSTSIDAHLYGRRLIDVPRKYNRNSC